MDRNRLLAILSNVYLTSCSLSIKVPCANDGGSPLLPVDFPGRGRIPGWPDARIGQQRASSPHRLILQQFVPIAEFPRLHKLQGDLVLQVFGEVVRVMRQFASFLLRLLTAPGYSLAPSIERE
jgi:hypothetical protein